MARRPIFISLDSGPTFVNEISLEIPWASGFAPVQKKKNVRALHEAAARRGFAPLLEVSTKSDVVVGRHLSAFHLKVHSGTAEVALESAYQGSKVFERGGPFIDVYGVDARTAKRDPRLRERGRLVRFEFDGHAFPLVPANVFYDWLYLTAIYPHREWLRERLMVIEKFVGFTDIEFNPARSINCQARSCAIFVALMTRGMLDQAVRSPEGFIEMMRGDAHPRIKRENESELAM